VEEEHFVHIKRNGTLMRITPFEPIYISRPEGEFIEFPDGSLAYATYDTWFSVNAYQDEGGASNVGTDRRLSLNSGELYIDVRPAKEGFSVLCPNSRTMVFGTQFYIRINSGPMKETTVVVRTGQVSVEKLGKDQMASTIVEKGFMTKVFSYDGTVRMRVPYKADSVLMKRLHLFNEAKETRTAQPGPAAGCHLPGRRAEPHRQCPAPHPLAGYPSRSGRRGIQIKTNLFSA